MSLATLKAETVDAKFANIPTMAPRPTHNNINAWVKYAIDILSAIPSQQSADHGYQGMVQHPDIYALVCPDAWEEWADPYLVRVSEEQLIFAMYPIVQHYFAIIKSFSHLNKI